MNRRDFLSAGIAAGISLTPSLLSASPARKPKVVRTANDRFEFILPKKQPRLRILQIADTHFGTPEDAYRAKDAHSYKLIRELIETHKADYIFHTGDFINNDNENVEWGAIPFMNSLGTPWSLIFGNHDHYDGGPGQKPFPEYYEAIKGCIMGYTERSGGRRDYCYRVDFRMDGAKPFASILAFNTGTHDTGMKVNESQTQWFLSQMEADKSASVKTPILVMQHVPTVEYRDVYDKNLALGRRGENVCFENDKGEIFNHYAESGRVRAIFCGHDHVNDYVGEVRKVKLVYGRCSGYGGYGDWERGARIIDMDTETGHGTSRVVLGKSEKEKPEWRKTLTDSEVS
jgi:hypothetical protein